MTSLLTCKDFLNHLNDYLDETEDVAIKQEVEQHISECPNCWVVLNTTKSTLKVFKGTEPQDIPADVHDRLMQRLQQRIAQKKQPG